MYKLNHKQIETMKDLTKLSKSELGEFLAPLTDLAKDMILAGVLVKNVIRHFTNKGVPYATAENIVACGKIKAEMFMNYKSK